MRWFFTSRRLTLIAILLLVALPLVSISAQDATPVDPITRIDGYLKSMVDSDTFSGSVLIARGDDILLNQGYGLADREWDIPNTPDSKFRIGSITKQFTAVAILMLQERGLLSVDDPICDYVEDCPDALAGITIHHLLTHTGGIPNITELPDFRRFMSQPTTLSALIDRFRDLPLDFEPGTSWYYSNSGYLVLGHIIQEVTDDSYRRFLNENIFDPLEMADTDYDVSASIVENRARGYASGNRNADYINMDIPFSAGGLYSSTGDLFRWVRALFNGQVIAPETLESSLATGVQMPGMLPPVTYAYGMVTSDVEGHRIIGHDGGINGFVTSVNYLPDDDLTIVILSNLETANLPDMLYTIVYHLLLNQE